MKQLWLQRHAQASGDWPGADHERPLSERGIRDAREAAGLPAAWGVAPAAIVCSSAERTETTAQIMGQGCDPPLEPVSTRRLYDGSPDAYLDLLRQTGEEIPALLLVGHNPTISMLGSALSGNALSMIPATLLVVDFEIERWADLAADRPGRLLHRWSPARGF